MLTLQNEIALEIADEIQLTLNGPRSVVTQSLHSPRQYEAYDLYLKGQYFLNKRTFSGLQEAAIYFQQATTKDPNYASAYPGLADSYALMGGYSERPQTEFISKARAAALKALEIGESLRFQPGNSRSLDCVPSSSKRTPELRSDDRADSRPQYFAKRQ